MDLRLIFGCVNYSYAKVRSGEIRLETYEDYINRHILQAREEDEKQKKK